MCLHKGPRWKNVLQGWSRTALIVKCCVHSSAMIWNRTAQKNYDGYAQGDSSYLKIESVITNNDRIVTSYSTAFSGIGLQSNMYIIGTFAYYKLYYQNKSLPKSLNREIFHVVRTEVTMSKVACGLHYKLVFFRFVVWNNCETDFRCVHYQNLPENTTKYMSSCLPEGQLWSVCIVCKIMH